MRLQRGRALIVLIMICLLGIGLNITQSPVQALAACPTDGGVEGGTISSNRTWSSSCSQTQDLTVTDGATLTINPGVVVSLGNNNTQVYINGTLKAQGTAGNPIRFTSNKVSPGKGDWGKIVFNPSSKDNILAYVTFEYSGAGIALINPAVDVRTSSFTMTNSAINHSRGDGLYIQDASPTISQSSFDNNDDNAIHLYDNSFPNLSTLTATNNDFNGILVSATGGSATISADYVWGAGLSTYRLNNSLNMHVDTGTTLTILPGTTIQMGNNNNIMVIDGTLNAQGTSAQPILITSDANTPAKGDWKKLVFNPNSINNELHYVSFEYGGAGIALRNPTLDVRTSSFTMTHSTINNSREDALFIQDASPIISHTSFDNNTLNAIHLYNNSFPTLKTLTATTNGFDGVKVNGEITGVTVNRDYTWGTTLAKYLVTADVTINSGSTLDIVSGTTVYVTNPNTDFFVNGTLNAQGTLSSPIRFTSGRSSPSSGDWGKISFGSGSDNSLLEYVTVEYAGSGQAIEINNSSPTIRYSTIARNHRDGIRVTSGSPIITYNNIEDNDNFGNVGLVNADTSNTVKATCNWWGDASGPNHSSNSDGTGQKISDGVAYDPWLVAPAPDGDCTGTNPKVYLPLLIK